MGFTEIKGQDKAVEQIQTGVKTGRIAHSYIFYGPKGVGKYKAAEIFSQSLNCIEKNEGDPCGVCYSCLKIASGNHPDIIKIVPDGSSIKISQIRGLQEKASYKSYEGSYKVIQIIDADRLTVEAANSLLKILEEPPEQTVFLLLAEDISKLPITIISRCQMISFGPLDVDIIQSILENLGLEINFPLGLAHGSVGAAIELQKSNEAQRLLSDVEKLLEDLRKNSYKEIFNWSEILEKNKDQIEGIIGVLTLYYRDRIIERVTGDKHLILDTLSLKDYRIEECYAALDKLNNALRSIKNNANVRLVLEVMLIDLKNIEQMSK